MSRRFKFLLGVKVHSLSARFWSALSLAVYQFGIAVEVVSQKENEKEKENEKVKE